MQTYTVKKGDTMSVIAKKYKIKLDVLLKSNPQITNPNLISVKQKIKIPVPPAKNTKTTKPNGNSSKKKVETTKKKEKAKLPKVSSPSFSLSKLKNEAKKNKATVGNAGTARIKGMFDDISFMFNPESISIDYGNEFVFTEASNGQYPLLHHKGGKTPTIQFELYINGREISPNGLETTKEDVQDYVDEMANKLKSHIPPLGKYVYTDGEVHKYGDNILRWDAVKNKTVMDKHTFIRPMIFSFGATSVIRVWVEDFKVNATRFNRDLSTMESTISVTLIMDVGW